MTTNLKNNLDNAQTITVTIAEIGASYIVSKAIATYVPKGNNIIIQIAYVLGGFGVSLYVAKKGRDALDEYITENRAIVEEIITRVKEALNKN